MTTELHSFEEAAAIAMAESGLAEPGEAEAPLPGVDAEPVADDGQAEVETEEQADSQTDTEVATEPVVEGEADESLFADIEIEDEADPSPALDESTQFELPGVESPVTLQELKEGYLRQSDYTRKTQQVADDRKTNEKAFGLWEALKQNPEGVVRQLAAQVGLIDEGQAAVKAVEFSPITTQEQMDAEIQSRVEAALAEHPAVVEAQRYEALRLVNSEMDRIAGANGVTLTEKDREVILREAQRRNVADLELVFTSLMTQRERKAQERSALKDAAPARPTGTPSSEARSDHADSFEEAAEMALLELGLKS